MTVDAKARLVEIVELGRREYRSQPEKGLTEAIADALLAAGVTLPPQPAGPVTSEGTVIAYEVAYNSRRNGYVWFDPAWRIEGRHAFDAIRDRYARDHGLLTPAEVERRAREWWRRGGGGFSGLVTALTAPTDTGKEGV